MLKVGLTGGIGSGKSTVAKIFEVLGIPVYYADEAARHIMNTDEELKKSIINGFGDESYVNDQLNRPYIASLVFNTCAKASSGVSFILIQAKLITICKFPVGVVPGLKSLANAIPKPASIILLPSA